MSLRVGLGVGLGCTLALGASSHASFTGFEGVVQEAYIPGFGDADIWRVYVRLDNPDDRLEAVSGNLQNPLLIETDRCVYYQHPNGGDIEHSAALEAIEPLLEYDTYVTIGSTDTLVNAPTTILAPINFAFDASELELTNSAWVRTPGDTATIPVDGRVLIGQFTVPRGADLVGTARLAGNIDGVDIQIMGAVFQMSTVTGPRPCGGDLDGDLDVDVDDLVATILNFGMTCPDECGACPADTNGDGTVNVDDLINVILQWSPFCTK